MFCLIKYSRSMKGGLRTSLFSIPTFEIFPRGLWACCFNYYEKCEIVINFLLHRDFFKDIEGSFIPFDTIVQSFSCERYRKLGRIHLNARKPLKFFKNLIVMASNLIFLSTLREEYIKPSWFCWVSTNQNFTRTFFSVSK